MSEVSNFSIHGSERIFVFASVLIKEKLPDFLDLRGLAISKLFVSRPVERCLAGGRRVHVEFKVISFECVFSVCLREPRERLAEQCVVYRGSCTPFPSPVFLAEPCRKSLIKDVWEGIDLFFRNYSVDSDPGGTYLWAFCCQCR